ncbi:MAG: aminoacyl-tRNA hydrolase [candidate division WOR-3 bacterium]
MIFFGLGNPGRRYRLTRHNIGFLVLDFLTKEFRIKFKSFSDYEEVFLEKYNLYLVKPLLYMNNSGVVVKDYLKKREDAFLVICDDFNLPFGEIRFRKKGSDGGHQGLANIIYHLNTNNFSRLRIGISPPINLSYTDYVLSEFKKEEKEKLPFLLEKIKDALLFFLAKGIERAMTEFNRKNLLEEK